MPLSHESRIISVIVAIAGGIFTAFMIGLIRQTLTLTKEEENIYSFVENHERQKQIKYLAVQFISIGYKFHKLIQKLEYFFTSEITKKVSKI